MALTWNWYEDAAGTIPTTLDTLTRRATLDGSLVPADAVIYWLSTTAGRRLIDDASNGVANIAFAISDPAGGDAWPTTGLILAASAGALATNTPGANLDLGVALLDSGAGNAVAVHIRFVVPATEGAAMTLTIAPATLLREYTP